MVSANQHPLGKGFFPLCSAAKFRCRSSVVEHFIGNEEAGGSIPPDSTSPHLINIVRRNTKRLYPAVSGRTQREPHKSGRGKSVESVREPFQSSVRRD